MSIAAIPGYDVKKIGKDRYSIAVTNGNMGAAVVNRAQLEQIADTYGVRVKDNSKSKKIVLGIVGGLAAAGAIAAGIIYRKNIGKFFADLRANGFSKNVENAKEGLSRAYNSVADFVADKWVKTKKFVKNLFKKQQKAENATVFSRGLSPELEKAKKAGILEYVRGIDEYAANLNSKALHKEKFDELRSAFAGIVSRSSLK